MIIDGFNKLTLLDYPGKVACIIFTRGCNLKCPFCQNSTLIPYSNEDGLVAPKTVLEYLEKRKNIIDGIVISGGEPLLQKDIEVFLKEIKALGYLIKLDTNGTNSKMLKKLIDKKLVDYVAMDIKSSFKRYSEVVGLDNFNEKNIIESIKILQEEKIDYEFRTTLVKEYMDYKDIESILEVIGSKSKYYLQNFVDSENVLKKDLHGFSNEEILGLVDSLKKVYPNINIRNL